MEDIILLKMKYDLGRYRSIFAYLAKKKILKKTDRNLYMNSSVLWVYKIFLLDSLKEANVFFFQANE